MAAARCFAIATRALLSRSGTAHVQTSFQSPALFPGFAARHAQQQRPQQRLRVLSSAAPAYWDDDTKNKVSLYSAYTVYKGKGAMSLKVIKPTWERLPGGLKVTRDGTVLLEFARNIAAQQYDWGSKEVFGLSAVECAAVLEATDARQGCDFYHDPNKGGSGEGTIQKTLSIKPMERGGWYFTVNVTQGGTKNSVGCNVSDPELRLIKTLMTFLIPRLIGFDEQFQGVPFVANGGAAGGDAEGAPF